MLPFSAPFRHFLSAAAFHARSHLSPFVKNFTSYYPLDFPSMNYFAIHQPVSQTPRSLDPDILSLIQPTSSCSEIKLHFTLSSDEMKAIANDLIRKSKTYLDYIANIVDKNFYNTIAPLAKFESEFQIIFSSLKFSQFISTEKNIRETSVYVNKLLDVNILMQTRLLISITLSSIF